MRIGRSTTVTLWNASATLQPMRQKLEAAQVNTELETTPGWDIVGERLSRTFDFKSYSSGAAFAVRVMMLSEKLDHHPDNLEIGWKKVSVHYVTHSAGGLTALDFDAARRVNALLEG
jgi:4a-hydroxytetrahydrobiopterin dehydratase